MTDKPAESAVERYNALEWVPDGEMGFDPGGREVKAAADAAIAELKAKLAAAETQRAAEAEAALSKCDALCKSHEAHAADCERLVTSCENDIDELRFKVREAEAERDRLMDAQARANAVIDVARRMASYRKRGGPRPLWNEFREELARYDARHFTPSRWQARAELDRKDP